MQKEKEKASSFVSDENVKLSVFKLSHGAVTEISRFIWWGGGGILSSSSEEDLLACVNIRFSSLFAAVDVLGGGTSATQRQKFHTDDEKSVRNPVRSADWSTE